MLVPIHISDMSSGGNFELFFKSAQRFIVDLNSSRWLLVVSSMKDVQHSAVQSLRKYACAWREPLLYSSKLTKYTSACSSHFRYRSVESITVVSLEGLVLSSNSTTWNLLQNYTLKYQKGSFVELKGYLAATLVDTKYFWRLDCDSVFVRPVHMGQYLSSLSAGTVVVYDPLKSCKTGWDYVTAQSKRQYEKWHTRQVIGDKFLKTKDVAVYGFVAFGAMWLYETAVWWRFLDYIKQLHGSYNNQVLWINRTLFTNCHPHCTVNFSDMFWRYVFSFENLSNNHYLRVSSNALLRATHDQPFAQHCPDSLHVDPMLSNPKAKNQLMTIYRAHQTLRSWTMQGACRNSVGLAANLAFLNQTEQIFLVTVAGGCATALRKFLKM